MALRYRSMKVGDTLGLLQYQMLDEGEPFPGLSGASVIFRMIEKAPPQTVRVNDKAGIVVDVATAIVGYQRVPLDVTTAALMLCEFTVTTLTGRVHISPSIELLITADLP